MKLVPAYPSMVDIGKSDDFSTNSDELWYYKYYKMAAIAKWWHSIFKYFAWYKVIGEILKYNFSYQFYLYHIYVALLCINFFSERFFF